MKLGVDFPGYLPGIRVLELAKLAEDHGMDSIWVGEHYFLRDSISTASAIAAVTERVKIGLCVVNPYTRNPALMAMTLASMDEISDGRIILGLGASIKEWVERMGITHTRPLTYMREYVEIVKSIVRGQLITHDGKAYRLKDVSLEFKPPRLSIPIFVAAMGPKMLRLAGEVGDGVIVGSCVPKSYMREALRRVREGLRGSGRTRDQFTVAVCALANLARNSEKAKSEVRTLVAKFIALNLLADPTFYKRFPGIQNDGAQLVLDAFLKAGPGQAAQYVSDQIIDEVAIAGDPGEFRNKLQELRDLEVDLPILNFPAAADFQEVIGLLNRFL